MQPHDLRRGAAKDIAHLKQTPRGLATPAVAAELGQSVKSLDAAGITAAYVGARNEDSWTSRVHVGFEDPFGLNVTNTVYRHQKLSKDEMKQLYVDMGIDASSHNERRKAKIGKIRPRASEVGGRSEERTTAGTDGDGRSGDRKGRRQEGASSSRS